ncbi:MAG: hypothetical protein QXT53_03480 [Ignisphaera sp.]
MVSIPESDGIYVYRDGGLEKIVVDGPFVPTADGVYVIYFRNRSCPGCKGFDKLWSRFLESSKGSFGEAVVVQCTNFFFNCGSQDAADTFVFYLVFETPQLVVVVVENGSPVYIEREVYFPDLRSIEDFVYNVNERRKKASDESSEEVEEGIYIDLGSGNWKEVVNRLRSMILDGKNLKELCDESGCRIYIE